SRARRKSSLVAPLAFSASAPHRAVSCDARAKYGENEASWMIHRLTAVDQRRLQELCRRFKERVPSNEEAASLLGRNDIYVWVADVEGDLAGFAYAYVLSRIDGDISVFLYELEGDARFRCQGLGLALVDQA